LLKKLFFKSLKTKITKQRNQERKLAIFHKKRDFQKKIEIFNYWSDFTYKKKQKTIAEQ